MFEVGGEDVFAEVGADFGEGPEAAAVEFIARVDWRCCGGGVGVYQFAFARGLEYVRFKKARDEVAYSQFLAGFAAQGFVDAFSIVHMSAHGCIPLAGLYVLPVGAFLQIQASAVSNTCRCTTGCSSIEPEWHSPRLAEPMVLPCSSTTGNISEELSCFILLGYI